MGRCDNEGRLSASLLGASVDTQHARHVKKRHAGRVGCGLLLAVFGVAAIVYAHPWPRAGADRVGHEVHWPQGCESIEHRAPGSLDVVGRWPQADNVTVITCTDLGPRVQYASFADARQRTAALAQIPPHDQYCLFDDDVIVDDLGGGFVAVCQRLNGRVVARP